MKQKNKRAQLQELSTAIILIVISVILLVLGLVIVQEIRDSDLVTVVNSQSFANETLSTVTETGENTVCATRPAPVCSFSTITNTTSGAVIPASNYTISNCNIAFTSGNSLGINNSNWNATYSCSYADEAYTAGNSSLVGLGDFADFIPIIVIAIVAGIVIAIILGSFISRRRQR